MATASERNQSNAPSNRLLDRIGEVRLRMYSIGMVAAIGWVLLAVVVVLMIAAWFDLLWELPPQARAGSIVVAMAIGFVVFCLLAASLLRKSNRRWLANRMDQVGETGGEIASGLDLSNSLAEGGLVHASGSNVDIESGLATMAVDRAGQKASQIESSLAIPVRPIQVVAAALAALVVVVLAIGFSMPKLATTQWSRFVSPKTDVPPFSMIEFDVAPGDVQLKYGEGVDIVARLGSTPVDELQLVLTGQSEEIVPMFAEGDNQWRATLFRVTQPLEYQVRSGRARSKTYSISLILVPEIKDVQFRVFPPAYTRLGASMVPGTQGIRALPGTRVEITAASNRPLSGGQMTLINGKQTETVKLRPASSSSEVVGEFEVRQGGIFEISLTDEDGTESTQTVSGSITLIEDTKPFVRMISPKQNSLATATVTLPIAIDAEDDFGISHLSLFRSLNDSRPLPIELEVANESSRWSTRTLLPLAEFDLQPGDKLELFARVEDNDPASSKGSESPIHVVQIISREQFEQLNQRQLGIEAVLAKYRQIQRRLEGLETIQREIEEMNSDGKPKSKPTDEQKQRMTEVAQEFKKSALEMQKLLERRFPVDFDRDLESRIEKMSDQMIEISREIRELIDQVNEDKIDNEKLKERLKELREKLEGIRDEFNKNVMQPLGQLAKIFPLMRKQQQFVQIVLRQRNLADRVRSLDGLDDVDQPDTKRRMRELADEQRALIDFLDDLLFEIENEAYSLPLGEEFNGLRDSALKFVTDVLESGAMDEQQDAEASLAEFQGTPGYKHANKAAEMLEKFVSQSQDVSNEGKAGAERIFKPEFGRPKLGNSMDQLMDLFGPKNGSQQQGPSNRGLYGDRPENQAEQKSGSGENQQGAGGSFSRGGVDADEPGSEIKRSGGNTGNSQVTIPLRYERKVGDYYRRIVEELGEDN